MVARVLPLRWREAGRRTRVRSTADAVFDESIVFIDVFRNSASRNVPFPALVAGLPGLPNQKTLPAEGMIRVLPRMLLGFDMPVI